WQTVPGTSRHILFFARDVPAVGYRIYTVRKGLQPPDASGGGDVPLKVEWSSDGWITSILDGSKEIVRSTSERPFGGLLLARAREDFKIEKLPPAHVDVTDGPIARRIRMQRSGSLLPLTEVILYRGAAYADLRFDVHIGGVRDSKPGGTRFALALPLPQ